MNHSIRVCVFLVFFLTQNLFAQTTEEEFRYTIYGYQEQLIKGMNDKEGYFWKPFSSYRFTDDGNRLMKKSQLSQFDFIGLYHIGTSRPCAMVCIYKERLEESVENWQFIGLVLPQSPQGLRAMAENYLVDEIKFPTHIGLKYQLALSHFAMALSQVNDFLSAEKISNYE